MHQLSSKKTQCVAPLSFHSFSNTDPATQERPVVTCVLFFCLCCSSSSGTDSSGVLTSLGVDTASIEWTAQPLWIVVNCSVFCLSFVPLRMTRHQHYYVRRWRRESVAVLHWQSYLCAAYVPSVPLLVCRLLWHSRARWLKWNGVTVTSVVRGACVCVCVCVHGYEIARGEGEIVCAYFHAFVVCMGAWVHFCVCVCYNVFALCARHLWMYLQVVWVHRRVGSESASVHVHLLQMSFTFLLADPLMKDFAVHLKHSRLRKVTFDRCTLTSVDVATLFAEGLSENRTLEQLHIFSVSSAEVCL